jgi:hypothetical protein
LGANTSSSLVHEASTNSPAIQCARCIKSGMTCDGYAEKKLPVKFVAVQPLAIQPNPSASLQLDEQEMRYFQDFVQDRFIDHRRKSLASRRQFLVTDTFFWGGIVLQESHATACTRHAIVAISALVRGLHRQWALCPLPSEKTEVIDPHHEFSLLQYHKALQNLRSEVLLSNYTNGPRTALVACLVLSFFDMLYGHGAFAARHMTYGRQIVTHWREKARTQGYNWIHALNQWTKYPAYSCVWIYRELIVGRSPARVICRSRYQQTTHGNTDEI